MSGVKIGLETHVQLDTETKLFCGCPNAEAEEPNTRTCPTCLGHPGSKPRTNEAAIDAGIQAGLALDCDIADEVVMSRKTYFYPDMSKNFQITQYEEPIAADGVLELDDTEIRIKRAHIEEDPAKILHKGGDMASADYTLVDYNRAGTPLLEVVTVPDFTSPEQARDFLQRLIRIMEYLGVYDRARGTVRSDANISMAGGNRVEVKNITGTREIQDALEHEVKRQKRVLDNDGEVHRETRNFDAEAGVTRPMRTKETEQDYGYIFEPDLVTVHVDEADLKEARDTLPELPDEKRERFVEDYGIEEELADSLVTDPGLADAFEAAAGSIGAELAASWFSGPIKKTLNYHEINFGDLERKEIAEQTLIQVLKKLENDEITDRGAEDLIRDTIEERSSDQVIQVPATKLEISDNVEVHVERKIEEKGLEKAGGSELEGYVEEVIDENPGAVDDYTGGDESAINFLVGKVMEKSGGSADPKEVRALLAEELGS